MLADGELLAGRYLLIHPLAAGGMSDVWKATDQVLERPVAVKVIRPGLLADPGFAQRFAAEARILAGLRHPGIVGVHDYGELTGPIAYLVMEFVDGEPLSDRLAREQRLSEPATMEIVAQAADALQAAHRAGVVHRDIKPANLLIRPDGTVVVVDFGIAKAQLSAGLTQTDTVLGTARYMAPEQVTGRSAAPTTDVYALGAVAYECLAGTPPFDADSPVAIAVKQVHEEAAPLPPTISASTRAVVTRAMAKNPDDRYPDAAALAAAARSAASGEPGLAATAPLPVTTAGLPVVDPTDPVAHPRPVARPLPVGRYAAIGAVVAVALAGLVFAANLPDETPPAGPQPAATSGAPTHKSSPGGSGVKGSPGPGASQPAGPTATAAPGESPEPATSPSAQPPPVSASPEPAATTGATEAAAAPTASP